jgi:DNA-binding NtrC family response regulator
MKNVLERKGYGVVTCSSGEEAIALAKDRPRDIFFIDMKLPVLNGLETYLEIRKVNPQAVVVMMTAYRQEMDELIRQAIEKGAYSCLHKPFDMDEAIRIVEEISKKKQKSKD